MADESIRPEAQDYLRQLVNEGLEHYAEEALDPEDNNFVTSLFSLPNLHLYHEAQDQLHIRFHQQLEDYAVEASADDSEEWCLKDLKPPISCACSMATSSLGKDPTVYSFPRFMELPLEIREQIYGKVSWCHSYGCPVLISMTYRFSPWPSSHSYHEKDLQAQKRGC